LFLIASAGRSGTTLLASCLVGNAGASIVGTADHRRPRRRLEEGAGPAIARSIERCAGEALRCFGYEVDEEPDSSPVAAGREEFEAMLAEERRGGERVRRQYREACAEINRLQAALDEQARWNTDIAKGIPERDAEIRRLQGVLEEQSRWNVNLHRGVSKWAGWSFFNRKPGGRPS